MENLHDAALDLSEIFHAPYPWNFENGIQLHLDAVISRDGQGDVLSYVGDFEWNWTFNTPRNKKSTFNFYFWKTKGRNKISEEEVTAPRVALMREMQCLMVLRVHLSAELPGYEHLSSNVRSLGKFARFAQMKGCSLRDVLEQTALLDAYIAKVPLSQCRDVVGWLNFLRNVNSVSALGYEIAQPKKLAELKDRAKQYADNQSQTAPLPTRIYLELINSLSSQIDEFESHRDRILAALREGLILHAQHETIDTGQTPTFGPALIEKHGLGDFLNRNGCDLDIRGLTRAVSCIQRFCKTQIHTFSGMRDEEAEFLSYHCMVTEKAGHGRLHSLILGVTTKLNGARRNETRWVTTETQGFRAIRLAQSFADFVYEFIGVTPSTVDKIKDGFPLFVSTAYLPWTKTLKVPSDSPYAPGSLHIAELPASLKAALCSIIEVSDIAELVAIDEFRDWANEPEFAIGQPWPLKSHQLRRSLALYANASGLVKSSSLRRQLQHITREMSEYYGRGSVFAKNFLSSDPEEYKKHICHEWQDSEQEAQYLAFTRDVLNSDEPLCGPGGIFYDLKKQRGEVMSANDVKHQLKMGRLAYKAHPLGGCTNVGTCDKQKGLRLTSGICISESCKSLVGKHSSIIKLIPIQLGIVSHLDPDSIVFQMEREELDILEAAEVQWQSSNRPVTASPGGIHV